MSFIAKPVKKVFKAVSGAVSGLFGTTSPSPQTPIGPTPVAALPDLPGVPDSSNQQVVQAKQRFRRRALAGAQRNKTILTGPQGLTDGPLSPANTSLKTLLGT